MFSTCQIDKYMNGVILIKCNLKLDSVTSLPCLLNTRIGFSHKLYPKKLFSYFTYILDKITNRLFHKYEIRKFDYFSILQISENLFDYFTDC